MTYAELIQLAISTAVAGTDVDNNPIQRQSLEAQSMADQALHELATMVAGDPELRARLETQFSVTLTSGVGSISAGMMIEFLREGAVRDSDTSANNGLGNVLARVNRYNQFVQDTDTALGLYCVVDNQIYARPPASVFPADTIGPLLIDAPQVPTTANLDTVVPDEITDDLVERLARRLRGLIPMSASA